MAKMIYCWRCKAEVPMLDDEEWAQVLPNLRNARSQIREDMQVNGFAFQKAKDQAFGRGALQRYFELTGFRETNIDVLWHHQLSLYGPPCATCGKPLRTPRAKLCAACGAPAKS